MFHLWAHIVAKPLCYFFLSKVGASASDRRFLGYHVAPEDVSVATYGRDNAAGPLRVLEKTLASIRLGAFPS